MARDLQVICYGVYIDQGKHLSLVSCVITLTNIVSLSFITYDAMMALFFVLCLLCNASMCCSMGIRLELYYFSLSMHSWRGQRQIHSRSTSVYILGGHLQVVAIKVRTRHTVVVMTTGSFCCCYSVRVEGHTFVVQDKQVTFLVELRKESASSLCIQFNRTTPSSHTSYRVNALSEDNRVHTDRRTASCRHRTWQGQ